MEDETRQETTNMEDQKKTTNMEDETRQKKTTNMEDETRQKETTNMEDETRQKETTNMEDETRQKETTNMEDQRDRRRLQTWRMKRDRRRLQTWRIKRDKRRLQTWRMKRDRRRLQTWRIKRDRRRLQTWRMKRDRRRLQTWRMKRDRRRLQTWRMKRDRREPEVPPPQAPPPQVRLIKGEEAEQWRLKRNSIRHHVIDPWRNSCSEPAAVLQPWLLPGCSSVFDSLVSNVSPLPSPPPSRGRERASNKPRRPSILERCILKCRAAASPPPLERGAPRLPDHSETNGAVLKRRQKQIQYGKNTSGYQNYLQQVPRPLRDAKLHPRPPTSTGSTAGAPGHAGERCTCGTPPDHLIDHLVDHLDPPDSQDPVEQLQNQLAKMTSDLSGPPGPWSRPLTPTRRCPPGLGSFRTLNSSDNMADWLQLLLEAEGRQDFPVSRWSSAPTTSWFLTSPTSRFLTSPTSCGLRTEVPNDSRNVIGPEEHVGPASSLVLKS
ncbi:hypothetical protein F7725_006321, partial [Dissostichus mawsoni]